MPKREDGGLDTKEKIFSAAAKLFAIKGYDSASVRDIAGEAGVNLALINYHFKDKKLLLSSVMERGLSYWGEMLEMHQGNSLEDLLRHLMKQAMDLKGAAYYLNIFMRMFLDTAMDLEIKNKLFINGAPKMEIIHRAIAREMGRSTIDKEIMLIAHYLLSNLILSSRIRFGVDESLISQSYICQFVEGEDVYQEQLLELARRLCRV